MNGHVPEAVDPGAPVLVVADARYSYGDRVALDTVSLSIGAGEIVVLLGPNGAGKSTLVSAIAGRLPLSAGSVRIAGSDPRHDGQARRASGIVPQNIALFEKLTARENLEAFGCLMGLGRRASRERAGSILAQVGLSDRAGDHVAELSGGMRRRVNIAVALMHAPRLLILDEPTVGVDVEARGELAALLRQLREAGLAILLTTHDLGEAELLADRIAIMTAGRLVACGSRQQVIRAVFGHRREVTLGLAVGATEATRAALARTLANGGFRSRDGRSWSAMLDEADARDGELVKLALASPAVISEVSVRDPGLAAVLHHFCGPTQERP